MIRGAEENPPGVGSVILPSLATAVLLASAMPGVPGWWPLLFVALVPLLSTVCAGRPGRALLAGLLAGFVYHACLLYWIVIVLGRYGRLPLVLSVPALLLLSLYMSLYTGYFAAFLNFMVRGRTDRVSTAAATIFVAPLLWVGLDWLRGFLFSGFPWMDLGYGLYDAPLLIQIADLGGHHLLSFFLVMINCLVMYLILAFRSRKGIGAADRNQVVAAVVLLVLAAGYSGLRFTTLQDVIEDAPKERIAVVQGNVPQDEKWTPKSKLITLDDYRRLTARVVGIHKTGLVVWPETALPFYPATDPLFRQVTDLAREQGGWLLTGAPQFSLAEDTSGQVRNAIQYYNSAVLVNPAGKIADQYDKRHLVPFGEYVPLENLLTFLQPLVESIGDFTAGSSGAPLEAGPVKVGTLICYESIFPALARDTVRQGANLLVNLTNDAWYGRSSAPYQSFAMAVFRAVETRRSLVRAANTGISGFVTPLGKVLEQTPIFVPDARAAQMVLLEAQTVFVRFGHLFAPFCLVLSLLLVFRRRRQHR